MTPSIKQLTLFITGASLILAGPAWSQIGHMFSVWPSEGAQEAPAIHGNRIVWHEFMPEHGDYDIVVADINRPDDIQAIALGEASDQMNPDVWEDTVVWQGLMTEPDESTHWDVWAANMSVFDAPVILNVSGVLANHEQMPRISGNTVIWEDGSLDNTSIYGADITDVNYPAEFPIAVYGRIDLIGHIFCDGRQLYDAFRLNRGAVDIPVSRLTILPHDRLSRNVRRGLRLLKGAHRELSGGISKPDVTGIDVPVSRVVVL
ncbi:MAG: hypothetical protein GY809_09660, partial [Planctomycetes bacterium]|nr:hypothetical protein [Planctomycetota bacterium]